MEGMPEGMPVEVLAGRMQTDDRGGTFFLFPEPVDLDLKTLHLVATRPGQVRGNHAHPARTEYLFFFGGQGLFAWEEAGRTQEMEVGPEGLLVRINPGVKHAYKNTGPDTSYILACWGPKESNAPDRVSAELIPQEPEGHA
jgi:mannose-6-phosphate isomerase-like protein (cupin superfamily)